MSELSTPNPLGIRGIDFVSFCGPDPGLFHGLFSALGFSRVGEHPGAAIDLYQQHDIQFLVHRGPSGFAAAFHADHGPGICALGLRVEDARAAFTEATRRGARAVAPEAGAELDVPAVVGIGGSLLYFTDAFGDRGSLFDRFFVPAADPSHVEPKGFLRIDHLTNNVHKGRKEHWADFYKEIFGFREIRHFDIRGDKTGLTSYALQSPCGSFSLPINEGSDDKSQIEEYLREYNGEGIQHLALLTDDLLASLDRMEGGPIAMLDIAPDYYDEAFARVPTVREDKGRIRHHNVLVDGDDDGYLLQIFSKNVVGPIFFELIQRCNHNSFGEGNFTALFRSIERDQERRGVLD